MNADIQVHRTYVCYRWKRPFPLSDQDIILGEKWVVLAPFAGSCHGGKIGSPRWSWTCCPSVEHFCLSLSLVPNWEDEEGNPPKKPTPSKKSCTILKFVSASVQDVAPGELGKWCLFCRPQRSWLCGSPRTRKWGLLSGEKQSINSKATIHCIQHEIDHINGVMFTIDQLKDPFCQRWHAY